MLVLVSKNSPCSRRIIFILQGGRMIADLLFQYFFDFFEFFIGKGKIVKRLQIVT